MRLRGLLLCALLLVVGGWLWLSAQDSKEAPRRPVITVEALENRLSQLEREREQLLANLHAYEGAIEECRFWIRWLKQRESENKKEPEPSKED